MLLLFILLFLLEFVLILWLLEAEGILGSKELGLFISFILWSLVLYGYKCKINDIFLFISELEIDLLIGDVLGLLLFIGVLCLEVFCFIYSSLFN